MATKLGQCEVIVTRPNAVLFKLPDGQERWVPESVIHEDSELWHESPVGETGNVFVEDWWAKKVKLS